MSDAVTVLIVNDREDKVNFWLPRELRKVDPNLRIIGATNTVTAIDMIAEHQPDILVCDVCIPHSEFDQTPPDMDREYINSRKVVEAFAKANPDGAILLDSPLVDGCKDFYPDKVTLLRYATDDDEHEKRLETIREAVDAQKQHKKNDSALPPIADSHGENPIEKEPSRIVQVRRSPWYDGSKQAKEESWSDEKSWTWNIKTSPLSTSNTPKLER